MHFSADQRPITLANWRKHPFIEWSFHNVRELLPTANISRSGEPTVLSVTQHYLEDIAFEGLNGKTTTVAEALRASFTDGFIVLHRGHIVSERYDHGFTPGAQHLVCSVSKSIAGTVGGILAEQGKLDPDAPVVTYLPELKTSAYGTCAVRHLLDMSVGVRFEEEYDKTDGDVIRYRRSAGWDLPEPNAPAEHLRQYLRTLRPDGNAAWSHVPLCLA
jgi:CubicO group peptidase (beta-lactamase class C family)